MTLSRWKIMTCILGLSVGGLAVCAGQSNNQLQKSEPKLPSAPPAAANPTQPATQGGAGGLGITTTWDVPADKPAAPAAASDTLPPTPQKKVPGSGTPVQEFELDLPILTDAAPAPPLIEAVAPTAGSTIKAAAHQPADPSPAPKNASAPPIIPAPAPPVNGTLVPEPGPIALPPAAPARVKDADKLPPLEIKLEEPRPAAPAAPAVDPFIAPKQANEVKPKVDAPIVPNSPPKMPTESVLPPVTSAPPATAVPPSSRPQTAPRATPATQKLKMLLRLGSGMPRFEIRTAAGEEMLLKVYAEKIEMKNAPEAAKASPLAGVTACGKVKFVGSGIEGTCDELTILSGTGEVMLKGNVHMKTRMKSKGASELTADKMIYQIGASGMMTPASTNRSTFTPVEYHENH